LSETSAHDVRSVLVVEDEPDIARVISLALKLVGRWEARACHDPRDIAPAIEHQRPDLILLDRMLAGTDSLEICKRLKASPATAGIPVIFLSAKCTDADRDEGVAAGAAGYLAKPFDPMELASQIRAVLSR
jgi:two-component system, OmpR family, phosphate regulon response regulator PhoB